MDPSFIRRERGGRCGFAEKFRVEEEDLCRRRQGGRGESTNNGMRKNCTNLGARLHNLGLYFGMGSKTIFSGKLVTVTVSTGLG